MAPHILRRQDHTNDYIAAGLLAGVIVFTALLCLLCLFRFERSRANRKRNAPSFHVEGVVRPTMAETNSHTRSIPPTFSRDKLTASIILPEKTITRKPRSNGLSDKAVVLPQPALSPTSSTPSLRRPLLNASLAPPRPRAISILNPAHPRHSRSSSGFSGYAKFSFPSRLSSRLSSASSMSPSQTKHVHQSFEPVLPDELAIRCGECLSVLQSFDDGWCVVARDKSRHSRTSLLATGTKNNGDNVDIGLVPTWVFTKPPGGNASSRPFRSTSLNVLNAGNNPASGRDGILSWANFA